MSKRKLCGTQKSSATLKFKSKSDIIEIDQGWTLEEFRDKVTSYLNLSQDQNVKITCQKHLLPSRKNFRRLQSLTEINFDEEISFQAYERHQKISKIQLQSIKEDFSDSLYSENKRTRY
jgi:hypothetical protein